MLDVHWDQSDKSALPEKLVLTEFQTPVGAQYDRPTCGVFAALGYMESVYMARGGVALDLSEQFLFWAQKAHGQDPWPDSNSSWVLHSLRAAHEIGVPLETAWPYEQQVWTEGQCAVDEPPGVPCFTAGIPSDEVLAAPRFRLGNEPRGIGPGMIKQYMVDQRLPVVVSIQPYFWQAWSSYEIPEEVGLSVSESYRAVGLVPYPNPADIARAVEDSGHDLIVIGWDDLQSARGLSETGEPTGPLETGFYVAKNSWGTEGVGRNNPYGAGYVFLSQRMVEDFGHAFVTEWEEWRPHN